MGMHVVIPAFEPGDRLPRLVSQVREADRGIRILVVDDGSGPRYGSVFDAARTAGADILTLTHNRGKGAALKAAFAEVLRLAPESAVVTADADGQHTATDILRVVRRLREDAEAERNDIILGSRSFSGDVPARSRWGNAASRVLFRAATGRRIQDTQTGLRGIPASLLEWSVEQPGNRFEYEQNVLLYAGRDGVGLVEIPIATVYLENNSSSHFRPLIDSVRVLLPVALFAGSSLIAFVVDTVALVLFTTLTGWLIPSVIAARLISASVNFGLNRRFVFRSRGGRFGRQLAAYTVLALALLASNIVWMTALTDLGLPLLLSKVITELVLFVTSYGVQRAVVFRPGKLVSHPAAAHRNHIDEPARLVNTN